MNQHQLNGVQSFLEALDQAAAKGIILRNWIDLEVDGYTTGLYVEYSDAQGSYCVRPRP